MALEALPTELQLQILGYLNGGPLYSEGAPLSRVMRTSKYFHKLAEPILYDDINLATCDDDRIKQLLITLTLHKDIRRAVHHFRLYYDDCDLGQNQSVRHGWFIGEPDPRGPNLSATIWSHITDVTRALQTLLDPHSLPTELKIGWLRKVLEPYPLLDGALALLLCLTTDINTISIIPSAEDRLSMTRFVLGRIDWCGVGKNSPGRPFQELQTLKIHAVGDCSFYSDLWIPPSVTQVKIADNSSL
jgi:hypothetical protein